MNEIENKLLSIFECDTADLPPIRHSTGKLPQKHCLLLFCKNVFNNWYDLLLEVMCAVFVGIITIKWKKLHWGRNWSKSQQKNQNRCPQHPNMNKYIAGLVQTPQYKVTGFNQPHGSKRLLPQIKILTSERKDTRPATPIIMAIWIQRDSISSKILVQWPVKTLHNRCLLTFLILRTTSPYLLLIRI